MNRNMNIGFHIPRDNHIKLFGSLIDFLLEKGCNVSLFCDYSIAASKMKKKAYQFPAMEKIPKFKKALAVCAFRNTAELAGIIQKNNVRAVFFVNFPPIAKQLKEVLEKKQYSFIAADLQHYYDIMLLGKDLSNTDVVYSYSKSWEKWWKEYIVSHNSVPESSRDDLFKEIDNKIIVVGFPEVDQTVTFKDKPIRRKYNIPENKKIVLLLPFPVFSSVWINSVYKPQPALLKKMKLLWYRALEYLPDVQKGIDDFEVTKAIRAFCDKNDALLLVKGRIKNPVPRYVRAMADKVLFDECFHPFISLELLFIANLSISFCSMTVMESVLTQTPSICLIPRDGALWQAYEDLGLMDDFRLKQASCYNFEGVVYNESVENLILSFEKKTFADYRLHGENRKKYIEKFLGFDDCQASKRIYEDLCRRLGSFGNTQLS